MSLLASVRTRVVVDVDSMNPDIAGQHATAGQLCDMTSNQAIVYGEATRPEQAALLTQAIGTSHERFPDVDEDTLVDHIVDLFTVLLAKAVYPYISGRVHAQTAPHTAYDTEKTVAHAMKLVSLFEANGIPRDRVCIKIPATPESILACQQLEKTGIRTLATCLFSVPQALAASQAGCLYIAPYFNELRVHFEPTVWKKYKNTAVEHPTAQVIKDIISTFKLINSKTLVMPASIVTVDEVIALVSLNPDHLTLPGAILDNLATLSESKLPEPVALPPASSLLTTDYLADNAAKLRASIDEDAETSRKLTDALLIFGDMENKFKALIRKQLQT